MAAPVTFHLTTRGSRGLASTAIVQAPEGSWVEIHKPKRTGEQNKLLHAALTDVARQVCWPADSGIKRDVESWKDIFTAAYRSAHHGLDVVPGINGGFVLLGMHTSRMTIAEVSDLIEIVFAFGAEHGVTFSDPQVSTPQGPAGSNVGRRVVA